MRKVMAGPILGEFGWLVFDIVPHVRAWLAEHVGDHRVVVIRKEFNWFFPEAEEHVDIPADLVPTKEGGRGWWQGQKKKAMLKVIAWAHKTVAPHVAMDIPIFGNGHRIEGHRRSDWNIDPIYKKLVADPTDGFVVPDRYIVTYCRDRPDWGTAKNWGHAKWDELVARVMDLYKVPVLALGVPGRAYFPKRCTRVPQAVENGVHALNHAWFSFGSNSGPTHLSQFSGCKTWAWGNNKGLKRRMEREDNHLRVLTQLAVLGWNPTVDAVFKTLTAWTKEHNI